MPFPSLLLKYMPGNWLLRKDQGIPISHLRKEYKYIQGQDDTNMDNQSLFKYLFEIFKCIFLNQDENKKCSPFLNSRKDYQVKYSREILCKYKYNNIFDKS